MMFRPLHKLIAISIAAQSAMVLAGPPDFGRDIRPILANSCFECHGPDESSREAELRLDTADGAQASGVIVPRRPDESELIKRLISNDPDEVMPPPNAPRRPAPQQVEQLRQWIADLLLPESVQGWQTGDVIRDPKSLDLLMATGFLRNHRYDTGSGTIPDESRFENAADRLENFSTIWLGMTMQCARCHDHKFDPIPSRDYYSLLAFFDKIPEWGMAIRKASHPFVYAPTADQRRQLAQLDKSVATSKQSLEVKEEDIVAEQKRWEATLNSFDNTRTVPFDSERVPRGLTHQFLNDQPFTTDGSTTKDLGKVVNNLITGKSRWTVSFWFQATSANDATLFSNVDKPEGTYGGLLADIVGGKLRLRHVCRWVNSYVEFISIDPVQVGQWQHVTFSSDGRSQGVAYRATLNGVAESMLLVEGSTGDNIEDPLKGNLIVGGGPFLPNFVGSIADMRFYDRELSKLESAFLAERRSLSEIAAVPLEDRSTNDDALLRYHFLEQCGPPELRKLADDHYQAIEERDACIRTLPTVMVMQEVAGRQTHIHTKGAYDQLGEPVTPMTPSILPPPVSQQGLDRIELADWLLRPDHPLTARVAVNRLWQQVWGRGFIDSPENFGTQSAEPLHHELLDWLATEYIRLKWDTKAILKLIATSAVFRQRSSAPPMQWKRDPENRMLARGPRFRLPIGVIRDSSLAMAGLLQRDIGGTTVLLEPLLNQDGNAVKLSFPVNTNRRTLYTFWKRNAPHPMLAVFDVADRNQCDVRVRRTNTPLQALVTLNEPGQIACAQAFAKRIIESEQEDVARLIWAFRVATSRTPSEAQLEILRDSLSNCRAIAETEVNAWTAVANVLLNLDETLTLE